MNALMVIIGVAVVLMGGAYGEMSIDAFNNRYEAIDDGLLAEKRLNEEFLSEKDDAKQAKINQFKETDKGLDQEKSLTLGLDIKFNDFNERKEERAAMMAENEDISIKRNKEQAQSDKLHRADGTNLATKILYDEKDSLSVIDRNQEGLEAETKEASRDNVGNRLGKEDLYKENYRSLLDESMKLRLFEKPTQVVDYRRTGVRGNDRLFGGLFDHGSGAYGRFFKHF